MASVSQPTALNPSRSDCVEQRALKAAELPRSASDQDRPDPLRRDISCASTRSSPPDAVDWDAIDPVTGLSNEYQMAMDIIDSCDYAELHRFNAPLLADRTMSIRQQIETYYNNGGESEEHRHKGKVKMLRKSKSVAEKVAAIVVFWRGSKFKNFRRDESK